MDIRYPSPCQPLHLCQCCTNGMQRDMNPGGLSIYSRITVFGDDSRRSWADIHGYPLPFPVPTASPEHCIYVNVAHLLTSEVLIEIPIRNQLNKIKCRNSHHMFRCFKVEGSTCFRFFPSRPNMEEDHIGIDAHGFFPFGVFFHSLFWSLALSVPRKRWSNTIL